MNSISSNSGKAINTFILYAPIVMSVKFLFVTSTVNAFSVT